LNKNAKKSVLKAWETQEKKNEKYLKAIQENPKSIEEKTGMFMFVCLYIHVYS